MIKIDQLPSRLWDLTGKTRKPHLFMKCGKWEAVWLTAIPDPVEAIAWVKARSSSGGQ